MEVRLYEKYKQNKNESGAIMLEGMIVTVITTFVLVWLLGIGFLYYQRYLTTIVTNDAAAKIAATYNNPTSDIIMGYVTTEDLSGRDLYRNFTLKTNKLLTTNEERAESYIKYVLDKANFSDVVENVDVELELVRDSLVRKHVKLTTNCTYNTPFGETLEFFGMDASNTYEVVSCADCTDVIDYISTVNYAKALGDGTFVKGTGFVESIVKFLNSLIKIYNRM